VNEIYVLRFNILRAWGGSLKVDMKCMSLMYQFLVMLIYMEVQLFIQCVNSKHLSAIINRWVVLPNTLQFFE